MGSLYSSQLAASLLLRDDLDSGEWSQLINYLDCPEFILTHQAQIRVFLHKIFPPISPQPSNETAVSMDFCPEVGLFLSKLLQPKIFKSLIEGDEGHINLVQLIVSLSSHALTSKERCKHKVELLNCSRAILEAKQRSNALIQTYTMWGIHTLTADDGLSPHQRLALMNRLSVPHDEEGKIIPKDMRLMPFVECLKRVSTTGINPEDWVKLYCVLRQTYFVRIRSLGHIDEEICAKLNDLKAREVTADFLRRADQFAFQEQVKIAKAFDHHPLEDLIKAAMSVIVCKKRAFPEDFKMTTCGFPPNAWTPKVKS